MKGNKSRVIAEKVQERRLKWCGHAVRREEHYVGRRAVEMKVQGRRKRGRPKRRWLDKVKDDMKEKGLSADNVYDRAKWRCMSSYIDPHKIGKTWSRRRHKLLMYYLQQSLIAVLQFSFRRT